MRMKTILANGFFAACIASAAEDLPSWVQNPMGTNGKTTDGYWFSTAAFQLEEFRLVLQEANAVALKFQFQEEKLPIKREAIATTFFVPFGIMYQDHIVGNVETTNYSYNVARGNKFSDLTNMKQDEFFKRYQKDYLLPISQFDTNMAYQMATQWLAKIPVDIAAMTRDLHLRINTDNAYYQAPPGMFVPFYNVAWCKKWKPLRGVNYSQAVDVGEWESVVFVQFYAPTKTIMQLSIKDSKYCLRDALVFTNLAVLLSTNAFASTNVPAEK